MVNRPDRLGRINYSLALIVELGQGVPVDKDPENSSAQRRPISAESLFGGDDDGTDHSKRLAFGRRSLA
jgi:hypothetical protein